jgi:hypothetical protein
VAGRKPQTQAGCFLTAYTCDGPLPSCLRRDPAVPDDPGKQRQACRWAGPELAEQVWLAAAQDVAQRQGDQESIVELPRQGDDVGHQVEGR